MFPRLIFLYASFITNSISMLSSFILKRPIDWFKFLTARSLPRLSMDNWFNILNICFSKGSSIWIYFTNSNSKLFLVQTNLSDMQYKLINNCIHLFMPKLILDENVRLIRFHKILHTNNAIMNRNAVYYCISHLVNFIAINKFPNFIHLCILCFIFLVYTQNKVTNLNFFDIPGFTDIIMPLTLTVLWYSWINRQTLCH